MEAVLAFVVVAAARVTVKVHTVGVIFVQFDQFFSKFSQKFNTIEQNVFEIL